MKARSLSATPSVVHIAVMELRFSGESERPCPAVQQAIADFFFAVQEQVEPPARYRLISQLGDGVERLAAEIALEQGWELQVILPCHRQMMVGECTLPESRAQLVNLLNRASAILELDGSRDDLSTSRRNADLAMLDHTDLLVAVWSGASPPEAGGSTEIIRRAAVDGISIYQLDPTSGTMRRLRGAADWQESLPVDLRRLLVQPPEQLARWHRFQREPIRRLNWGWLFALFRNSCASCRFSGGSLWLPEPFTAAGKARPSGWDLQLQLPSPLEAVVSGQLLDSHARADHLANFYAGVFRSAYLTRYLLAGVATLLVAAGIYTTRFRVLGFVAQIVVLTLLLALVWAAPRWQWHRRSLEYRSLAEQLRHFRFLWPLGAGFGRLIRPGNRLGEPPRWITHQLWLTAREVGVPPVRVDASFVQAHGAFLRLEEVDEQLDYHRKAAAWQARLATRLKTAALVFFGLGVVAIFTRSIFSAIENWDVRHPYEFAPMRGRSWHLADHGAYCAKLCSIIFPALGGLFAGVRSHGEFARLASRSETMADYLASVGARLAGNPPNHWEEAVACTADLVRETSGELADWRTLIGGKDLAAPV